MGVIKSGEVESRLRPFSLADIEAQAEAILEQARQQAQQTLIEGQRAAQSLRAQVYHEALRTGRADGTRQGMAEGRTAAYDKALEEGRQELGRAVAALNGAAAKLEAQRGEMESDLLSDVVELALAIGARVAKRQGKSDFSVVRGNVVEALRLVGGRRGLRIAVHPSQRAALAAAMPRLGLDWADLGHVELVEDESLAPGGCRLFTAQGSIDADLERQIERIAAELSGCDGEPNP